MIIDHCRNIREFLDLYNSIDNSNLAKAEDILNLKDYCFCFYEKDKLLGAIYLEGKDDNVYLSGFSKRKNLKNIIEGIKFVCDYFSADDIYSETPFKHAELVLKKAGFEHFQDNIYIKRSKK